MDSSPSLPDALASLRRRYGQDVVHRGQEADPVWATGMSAIDGRLTAGGLPRARLSVLVPGTRGATGRLTLLQSLTAAASRDMETVYVDVPGTLDPGFLADLGAELGSCLVVTPGTGRWAPALAMARTLTAAGVPWLGIALDEERPPRAQEWEHALVALTEAVWRSRSVCVVAAPSSLPPALAHASSLTLACVPQGWEEVHGDVLGLRVRIAVVKSRVGRPGAGATVVLRYPRPHVRGGVIDVPGLITLPVGAGREDGAASRGARVSA